MLKTHVYKLINYNPFFLIDPVNMLKVGREELSEGKKLTKSSSGITASGETF